MKRSVTIRIRTLFGVVKELFAFHVFRLRMSENEGLLLDDHYAKLG